MGLYKVTIEVTQSWNVEVNAEDEQDAKEIAGDLDLDQITCGGDYNELLDVDVVGAKLVGLEDEE